MNEEIIGSKSFGYVLYDNGTFPVITNIDREFFAENYLVILEAMAMAGIYDSYIFLIKQVLGSGAVIEFDSPRPRHLVIGVESVQSITSKLLTSSGAWLTTKSNRGILTTRSVSDFTANQLSVVLRLLANPSGTFLEINFGD